MPQGARRRFGRNGSFGRHVGARTRVVPDDAELLHAADGPEGFDLFYRRYQEFVVRFIGRRLRDPEATLDLTSEVFAAAYLYRHTYDPARGPVRPWLVGIARNKIAHYARSERAASEARRRLGLEHQPPSDADLAEVESLIAAAERLAELPAKEGAAIWQRHILDRPYDEIAAERSVRPATVRKRVSTGLARLGRRVKA